MTQIRPLYTLAVSTHMYMYIFGKLKIIPETFDLLSDANLYLASFVLPKKNIKENKYIIALFQTYLTNPQFCSICIYLELPGRPDLKRAFPQFLDKYWF